MSAYHNPMHVEEIWENVGFVIKSLTVHESRDPFFHLITTPSKTSYLTNWTFRDLKGNIHKKGKLRLLKIPGFSSLSSAISICQYNYTTPANNLLKCSHPSDPWFNQFCYNNSMICVPLGYIFTCTWQKQTYGEYTV